MKVIATFAPTLKNAPNGQGHRIEGDYDPATQLLEVKCAVTTHAPAGRFYVHCASRIIIAPEAVKAVAAETKHEQRPDNTGKQEHTRR